MLAWGDWPLTSLLVHESFRGVLLVKVRAILEGVGNNDGHFPEFLADRANGMWPIGCSLESASPVGNEVLRHETECVRGVWIARGTTNVAILKGLERGGGKRFGEQ